MSDDSPLYETINDEDKRTATLMRQATDAVLNELKRLGLLDNAPVCMGMVGTLMGNMAANTGDPEAAMRAMNDLARKLLARRLRF